MKTTRAKLANWKSQPLHPDYIDVALRHAERMRRPGRPRHAYETTCPFCGDPAEKSATVRISSKETLTVPATGDGYLPGELRCRVTELDSLRCAVCGAVIDPLAYLTPPAFVRDKECCEVEDLVDRRRREVG